MWPYLKKGVNLKIEGPSRLVLGLYPTLTSSKVTSLDFQMTLLT